MSKEQEIIKSVLKFLPRSKNHLNEFFESDAEIISHHEKKLLFSLDEFSEEDYFRDHDPYTLGWNVCVCTISDILASGGNPEYFAHSMVIEPHKWDTTYLELFSRGIGDALKETGCSFISGDTGTAEKWHYTGVVIGETENPITRKGSLEDELIYISGPVGAGNLEAALKIYSNHRLLGKILKKYQHKFPIRQNESQLLKQYASSCIDTSDGILNALNTLSEINNIGYNIEDIPYLKDAAAACKLLGKPKSLLFLGECGEYELLFTIKKTDEQSFLKAAEKACLSFYKIGKTTAPGNKTISLNNKSIDISNFDIQARNYSSIKDYLKDLTTYAKKLK